MSRTKRAFKVKQKTFSLVSQVLSFRNIKQTNKNVADTPLKDCIFSYQLIKNIPAKC